MNTSKRYSPEIRERAVRMVLEQQTEHNSQWGGLLTYRTNVGGENDRADTSVFAAQPFYFIQMGGGYYFRGAPVWVFDLENETYHVPVGLGFGKVFKSRNTVFNVFAEPQVTILDKGVGQPQFQLFVGFNMQFN
jgi:hypothetical protein